MLKENMQYRGVILSIQHAAEHFQKKNSTTMMYCHFLKINVESQLEVVDAQVCVAEDRESTLEIDSEIKFTVTRFAKNRYTVHVIETMKSASARKREIELASKDLDNVKGDGLKQTTMPEGYIGSPIAKQPVAVSGVDDSCLYAAAIFHMMRTSTVDDMLATAKEIKAKYYL